ncbi:MAG: hypothetical protein AB2421_20670 [Thermotaleaceae bacterium]
MRAALVIREKDRTMSEVIKDILNFMEIEKFTCFEDCIDALEKTDFDWVIASALAPYQHGAEDALRKIKDSGKHLIVFTKEEQPLFDDKKIQWILGESFEYEELKKKLIAIIYSTEEVIEEKERKTEEELVKSVEAEVEKVENMNMEGIEDEKAAIDPCEEKKGVLEATFQENIIQRLKKEGIEFIGNVENRDQLLYTIKKSNPEFVILSIRLPGFQDFKSLIDETIATQVNLIFLAGDADPEDPWVEEIEKRGVKVFFDPIKMAEVVEIMQGKNKEESEQKKLKQEDKKEKPPKRPLFNINITKKVVEKTKIQEKEKVIMPDPPKQVYLPPQISGSIIIGVAGIKQSVGCTHTAYSMANFLGRLGRTAYVELSQSPVMYQYFREEKEAKEIEGGYQIGKNFDVYVKYLNGKVHYHDVFAKNYQYIILDLGQIAKAQENYLKIEPMENYDEMIRTNIPILVGTAAKWQLTQLAAISNRLGQKHWKIYVNFANPDEEKNIKRAFKEVADKEAYLAPYSPNMFELYDRDEASYSQLLKEYIGEHGQRNQNFIDRLKAKIKRA